MFKALSMAPAPNPRGSAQRQKKRKLPDHAIPRMAIAVSAVLTSVTRYVPHRWMRLSLLKLEKTVPHDVISVTKLPNENGNPMSA